MTCSGHLDHCKSCLVCFMFYMRQFNVSRKLFWCKSSGATGDKARLAAYHGSVLCEVCFLAIRPWECGLHLEKVAGAIR